MSTQLRSTWPTWEVLGGAVGVFLLAFAWFIFGILPTGAVLLLAMTVLVAGSGVFLLGYFAWQVVLNLRNSGGRQYAMTGLPAAASRGGGGEGPNPRQEGARTLDLDPDEATLLIQILNRYLADSRLETTGAKGYAMREGLKHDESTARRLLSQVRSEDSGATVVAEAAVTEMRALAEAGV
jgi:hypothetical protein